ncbi:MAG: DUF2254 domain-containing protein [Sphingomonas sp.]|nr:MAG: DUF2254 domain-containing protein [Sphingomonas sp.]
MTRSESLPTRLGEGVKRALKQFLALPLAVVIGFIAITAVIYWADQAWSAGKTPAQFSWLGQLLGDSSSLATLLATVASSIITVTSITFSLLLIALQQGASALTTQVTDQFLMRRSNQFYFGYFVGLSVFTLLSLVTASSIHRPVFGTSLILILTIAALCMIVVMIYDTIDQMRPTQIVRAIHQHVLGAREREAALLRTTRRVPRADWGVVGQLRSTETGHIIAVKADKLRQAIEAIGCGDIEVELRVPIGRYLAFNDPMATLRARTGGALGPEVLDRVRDAVGRAISFHDTRDLRDDPAYGISQLSIIAWTSISTAKSNPAPGLAVIQSLRDILARWSAEGPIEGDPQSLVVIPDVAPTEVIATFENIILVTSESIQAQTLAHTVKALAILLETVPAVWGAGLAEASRRLLSSLGEHVLTVELEAALAALAETLSAQGYAEIGKAVDTATARLATTLGSLNSRSTRVPGAG